MTGINCKIALESRQKMGSEAESNLEKYEGTLNLREGKSYLSYKRASEDGPINCMISFNRKGFTMIQKGPINSKLELIPGSETHNIYGTPMGNLDLKIYTRHYQLIESKNSIKILIDYDIITGAEAIQTSMDISVRY